MPHPEGDAPLLELLRWLRAQPPAQLARRLATDPPWLATLAADEARLARAILATLRSELRRRSVLRP